MNPTEIYDALAEIAAAPFDPNEFPFTFAEATDAAKAAISKLRGTSNKSDLPGGVLFNRKFHYAPALAGLTDVALEQLRNSKRTKTAKPAILVATDGETVAAEHPASGDTLHCRFDEIGDNFGFFLPAAGKERYLPHMLVTCGVPQASRIYRHRLGCGRFSSKSLHDPRKDPQIAPSFPVSVERLGRPYARGASSN